MTEQKNRLESVQDKEFDIAIVGGGIIGAGIARDAALRGLRVALFEKDDYGSGTSSRSTRLIHGGLRYLEMLDFGLVRMDLKEREILLKIASHLVKPLAFVVPMYRKTLFYRTKLRIGMWLYDWLSYDKSLPNHQFLSKDQTLAKEPSLKAAGLQGASVYYDAQVALVERLTLENILAAQEHGAKCFNYTKVESLVKEGSRVTGLLVSDQLNGADKTPQTVKAKLVINAAGPWLDPLEEKLTGEKSRKVRRTKGIHLTAPKTVNNALVLFAEEDGRLFFVIPWLGYSWVGTTDTDFNEELESVRATHDDVEYLLETVRGVFPDSDWDTIYFTNAGVRALALQDKKSGKVDESEVSRKHDIVDHDATGVAPGMVSVVGGKITAYRGIAEEVVNVISKKFGRKTKGVTGKVNLPGAIDQKPEEVAASLRKEFASLNLSQETADYLVLIYGSRARQVLRLAEKDSALAAPIHPAYPDILAQLPFAVKHEQCQTVRDFMMRRTSLYFRPDQGRQAAPTVSAKLAELLGWDKSRRNLEEAAYAQEVAWTQEWRETVQPALTQQEEKGLVNSR